MLDITKIEKLINKALQFPAIAHTYALEIDLLLRASGEKPATFSAKGWSDNDLSTVERLKLPTNFMSIESSLDQKAILSAENLIKKDMRFESLSHVFENAAGPQVNALNLFYANHTTQDSVTRLYYLNKYLNAYGLGVKLREHIHDNFFYRLATSNSANNVDGSLVTIIMPAHNAEKTIELAVNSLLVQSWQNLQIIIIDDASSDSTLQKAKELAKRDARIEVLSNPVNVGPYVCRNLGVLHTRGEWLTVHDADDWAFPDRIEQQVKVLTERNVIACTGRMLRMNELGQITRPTIGSSNEEDGYLRLCFASLMVHTAYFRNELGAWDSVRVGGDAELIERLKVMGAKTSHLPRLLMLCQDNEAGLTSHQEYGLADENGQKLPFRAEYKNAFMNWHKSKGSKKISIFANERPFGVSKHNLVDLVNTNKVFARYKKDLELIKESNLFDEVWYQRRYPEVDQTGLELASHYLVYGATGETDPGPNFSSRFYLLTRSIRCNPLIHFLKGKDTGANPKRVLLAAEEIAKKGDYEKSISLAETNLPQDLAYTAHILKANAALDKGNETDWQEHLNAYLAHFNVAPIYLDACEGNIFNRLNTAPLPPVIGGPLITAIMPVWNAEKTVRKAAQSILNQTWQNLELLIVDDASTDGTWSILQEISASDARVKIFRNKVNVGPYVSKNIALTKSKGDWITGHDADDWAFPQRLEKQCLFILNNPCTRGLLSGGLRMNPVSGQILEVGGISDRRIDGVIAPIAISGFFEREFLLKKIGYWDSSRFGADSELIDRSRILLGDKFKYFIFPCEIYMDTPSSLTNQAQISFNKSIGISPSRIAYRNSWMTWHKNIGNQRNAFIEFPQYKRHFDIPDPACVSIHDVEECLNE